MHQQKMRARRDITSEIDTRFQTISLQANAMKYKQSIALILKKYGFTDPLYARKVINPDEIEHAKSLVSQIILTLKKYQKRDDPILNPFSDQIGKIFPSESGARTRQFQRLMKTSNLLTLCNAKHRPKLEFDGKKYPVTHLNDVSKATQLIIDNTGIPSHKIRTFNEVIKPTILTHGKNIHVEGKDLQVLIASEILTHYKELKEKNYNRQQLLETILIPLTQYGFLERTKDPNNKSRDIFWIPDRYLEHDVTVESTLIDTTTLDESCIRSFVKNHFEQRYKEEEYQFYNTNDKVISVEELCIEVTSIDA